MSKMKIGICRPAPLHIIPNTYKELDINVNFVKGIINMFNEQEITICSPMNNEDEKILNNQKLSTKYPYLKNITYNPYEQDMNEIEILFIFSKDVYGKIYLLQDGISYDDHVNALLDGFKGIVFYIQYNDVNYEFCEGFDYENINFIALLNSPKSASFIYDDKNYGDKDIQGYCLDLSELVFNSRISNVTNFYHKISLFNNPKEDNYEDLKNVFHSLYTLNNYKDGEDEEWIKNNNWKAYDEFIYKLQHSTVVLIDNLDTNYYNPYYFLVANYTLPILRNNKIDFQIDLEPLYYYKEEKMLSYLVEKYKAKHMKALRIIIKDYFKNYDLKSRIMEIIKRES